MVLEMNTLIFACGTAVKYGGPLAGSVPNLDHLIYR